MLDYQWSLNTIALCDVPTCILSQPLPCSLLLISPTRALFPRFKFIGDSVLLLGSLNFLCMDQLARSFLQSWQLILGVIAHIKVTAVVHRLLPTQDAVLHVLLNLKLAVGRVEIRVISHLDLTFVHFSELLTTVCVKSIDLRCTMDA